MSRLLTSCFGLGYLPVAPGTWGSIPAAVAFAILSQCNAPGVLTFAVMAGLIVAGAIVCVTFTPAVIAATGKADPSLVVVDEFAGQAVTFLLIGFLAPGNVSTKQIWIITGLGFSLFRLFDIVKPWPIRALERLPQGWGVLADDIAAGAFAAVILIVCIRLWFTG